MKRRRCADPHCRRLLRGLARIWCTLACGNRNRQRRFYARFYQRHGVKYKTWRVRHGLATWRRSRRRRAA